MNWPPTLMTKISSAMSILRFQELLLEACAAAEGYDGVFADHEFFILTSADCYRLREQAFAEWQSDSVLPNARFEASRH